MERQLLGTLLLLLLQLTLASETSGQDDQQMGQSTSPGTLHNSVLQTASTGAAMEMTTILATASKEITTIGIATSVMTPMADTQEGRITTTSPSTALTTIGQDMAPSTTTFKNHSGTTQSTLTQPMEAANTTERQITDEDTISETKATLITSMSIPMPGENTNSSTTKMASDMVNGTIKATPTASTTGATIEKDMTQPTATINSLFKSPEGTFPNASIASATDASTAKATESIVATMSKTPGEIPPRSTWPSTHAGTNGPMKTTMSETNPVSVPLTTITTTKKDMVPSTKKSSRFQVTNATAMISMTVTEALKRTADIIPTYPRETTISAGTVLHMMTMSETKAKPTVPATADAMKDIISSVATMSSSSRSQGGIITHAPTGSMKLTDNAGVDMRYTLSPKTTTTLTTALNTGSSGTNTSSAMSVANGSLPTMRTLCASDEYPSTKLERGCMCNSSYYAHPEVNNVTVALFCRPWEMEVSLSQCFLETHGWVQGYSLFPECSGISKIIHGWRAITFVVKRNESACGLRLSTNTSHALYSLKAQLPPTSHGSKSSNGSIDINISCAYPLVVNVNQKVTHQHININVTGAGDSIITLSIFTDAQYTSLLVDQPVAFHTPLYVALEATNADPERFVLVANDFFASTNASGASAPETTYYFVKYSCPVSERLLTQPSTNGVSLKVKLAFRAFRFFTSNILYYHSHVTLCDKQGNSSCQPTCTRMSQKQKNLAEMDHQNKDKSGWLTYGPIRFQGSDPFHSSSPAGPMRIWLTFLLLVVISWMLA